jgi:hypothetical protein
LFQRGDVSRADPRSLTLKIGLASSGGIVCDGGGDVVVVVKDGEENIMRELMLITGHQRMT